MPSAAPMFQADFAGTP